MAMSESSSSKSGGIGFVGLLTIVFIVLKLTKVIAWSWWWVLSPVWISAIFAVAILLVFAIFLLVIKRSKPRKLRR
jgi:membrane protein YdbS with pleckstrin-like domain